MTDKTSVYDLDISQSSDIALNNPEELFSINPYAVWQYNSAWILRWQPHWAALNKPLDMIKSNPGWMCAIYPETVTILNVDVMMQYYPTWVKDYKPDIYMAQPAVPGERRPLPALIKRRVQQYEKISLWQMVTGWFSWLNTPKFDTHLSDSMKGFLKQRKSSDHQYYPPGVKRN